MLVTKRAILVTKKRDVSNQTHDFSNQKRDVGNENRDLRNNDSLFQHKKRRYHREWLEKAMLDYLKIAFLFICFLQYICVFVAIALEPI